MFLSFCSSNYIFDNWCSWNLNAALTEFYFWIEANMQYNYLNSKHWVLPPFYHRDWVFLVLTNPIGFFFGGGMGAVWAPPNGGLSRWSCDNSTGL